MHNHGENQNRVYVAYSGTR